MNRTGFFSRIATALAGAAVLPFAQLAPAAEEVIDTPITGSVKVTWTAIGGIGQPESVYDGERGWGLIEIGADGIMRETWDVSRIYAR